MTAVIQQEDFVQKVVPEHMQEAAKENQDTLLKENSVIMPVKE
jgi:hypothetical protein